MDLNSAVMPVSSWMILGFVSTMKWTFEGTVHTATSRVLGTCLGCACIYGAMMTTNSYEVMLAWNFALCFATFFIFANPADVYSSFHPEFGLIGQVFLWTCMFIFQTVWLRMDDSSDSPSGTANILSPPYHSMPSNSFMNSSHLLLPLDFQADG